MNSGIAARWISIGGGKGGVGKSLIAANLGVAMARMGHQVVIVDADLGAANQHTLLGVDRIGPTVRAFLDGQVDDLSRVAVLTPVEGLRLVPGMGAVARAHELTLSQVARFTGAIRALEADVVIVDCGAGASPFVVDCFNLADLRLVALSPQITAIHNAYAFLKVAVYRTIRNAATSREELSLLAQALAEPESARVADWLVRVWEQAPPFAARIVRAMDHFAARIVGNMLIDDAEAGMLQGVSRMVRDLLGINAPVLATLFASRHIHDSVNQRRPFILEDLHEHGSSMLVEMAEELLAEDVVTLRVRRAEVPVPMPDEDEPAEVDGTLPKNAMSVFVRRHDRRAVAWRAVLEHDGVTEPVRVREISLGGALLELTRPIDVGSHGRLIFEELPDQPSIAVEIRHVRGGECVAGVQFLDESDMPARLVAAAKRRERRAQPAMLRRA